MSEKASKIKILKKEIEVKDKLIGKLLNVIAENQIVLDPLFLSVISSLYNLNKGDKEDAR